MNFINKFLFFTLTLTLITLGICFSFTRLFDSEKNFSDALDKSGIYSLVSQEVKNNLSNDLTKNISYLSKDDLDKIISAISPLSIRKTVEPIIAQMTNWLKNPIGNDFSLKADTEIVRINMVEKADKTLGEDKAAKVKFEITKSFPDSINILALDGGQKNSEEIQKFNQLKAYYQLTNRAVSPLILFSVGTVFLLFFFNIRRGKKKFNLAAASFILTGILGLIAYFIFQIFIKNYDMPMTLSIKNKDQISSALMINLSKLFFDEIKNYSILMLIIAAGLFIAGLFLAKSKNKD
ncbi:MAG: hypothetical protein Q8P54_00695 [bacterium]|nr:hypothetical protein [bacterium]